MRKTIISISLSLIMSVYAYAQWEYSYYHYPPHRLDDCKALDSLTFWVCGAYGYIIKSTDSGRTWDQETRGPLGSGIDFYEIDFYGHQYGWAATGPGGGCSIVSTADYGETWQVVYEGLALTWPSGLQFSDSLNGILAGRETIYRTTDGGQTWLTPDSIPAGFVCLDISCTGETLWACGGTSEGPEPMILRTTDGGNVWELNWQLGDTVTAAMRAIEFSDAVHGWATATRPGINACYLYGTSNGGQNWQLLHIFEEGETIQEYDNIEAIDSLNLLVAAITSFNGGKIKRSSDGGLSWATEFEGGAGTMNGFSMYDSTHGLVVGGPIWDYSPLILYYDPSTDAIENNNLELPISLEILTSYPNPFNSATTITLTGAEQADIGIYDITGRLITTLHTTGGHALWDAEGHSSGVYFAKMITGNLRAQIKLVYLK